MFHTVLWFLTGVSVLAAPCQARGPNVIVFYADDMGYGDAGCFGGRDIQTPNIDQLASRGIMLTDYYSAAPVCSPSRAALLTGRYPARIGMSSTRNIASAMGVPGMPTGEITIAELARTKGYATGIFGKWHLGASQDTQPNAQGFDLFFGHHGSCVDSYSHMFYASVPYYHDLYKNRQEVWEGGQHMTDIITREAVRFIEMNRQKPFLIYVSYNTPHYPMVSPSRFLRMYTRLPERRKYHAALVTHLDESLGRIMAELEKHGLVDDTLVFFSSDNGAADKSDRGEGGGSNAPFREFKRSLFDGGIHMPAVVSWPRRLPQSESRSQLAIAMDLFVTVADAIGADLPDDRVIDGRSWLPFLSDPDESGQDVLFFDWAEQHAVRRGKWKVVRNGFIDQATLGRANRAAGVDRIFLSDVSVSPGEKTNLYRRYPEVAEELLKLHTAWRESIGVKRPSVQ